MQARRRAVPGGLAAAPGSPFDAFGRPVGIHVAGKPGQPIVVDNRGGAGSTIGAGRAARGACMAWCSRRSRPTT